MSKREIDSKFICIELLSVDIASINLEFSTENIQLLIKLDVSRLSEILSVCLSWLIECELLRQFLTTEHEWEWISATVLEIDFSDLQGVISEVVMKNVRNIGENIEFQDFSIIFKELLLRWHSSTTLITVNNKKNLNSNLQILSEMYLIYVPYNP